MAHRNHRSQDSPSAFVDGRVRESLTSLSRELGPVVYVIRTDDGLVKIGHTTDLASRKRAYGSGWDRILLVQRGTVEDEAALHERFAEHVARGREYFHPAPALLAFVNESRALLGVGPA